MRHRAAALIAALALFAPSARYALAQATNPPYLAQFPTVDKVKRAMQVSDPRETALRQMGALWQLQHVIKQLSGSREIRGLLPDEGRLVGEYGSAAYYIGRAIDSAFPGPYGNWRSVSANTPYGYARSDPRFGIEGIETFKLLLSPEIEQLFGQSVGAEQARRVARARADSEAMLRARAQVSEPQQPSKLAEEQAGIRRCVESGRSETQCMMEGIGKSFRDMVGGVMPGVAELMETKVSGLRMSGAYPGPGKLQLSFYPTQVTLVCADLEPQALAYTVAVQSGAAVITIETAPRPVSLTVRPDERLAGPAAADITGQVQVGTEYGTRTWSDGRTEPISRPVYQTFTRRCSIGTLTTSGPASPLGMLSTAATTVVGMVFGNPDKNAPPPTPPGLRMAGEYGARTAFDVEFRPEGAVVGCREVTILRPYTVKLRGTQVMVDIAHGSAPFSLSLGADGRLSGTGTIRVDGRAVTGTTSTGELNYVPRSASCGLGSIGLAGRAGSGGGGGTPAAAPPPPAGSGSAGTATGVLGPGAAALATPAPGSGAIFQVESGIVAPAGSPNPLAGRSILLLNDGLENILREAGMPVPAGSSATRVLMGCNNANASCQKLSQAIASHAAAILRPDQRGIAQSPELEPGRSYYLLASAVVGGKTVVWSMPLAAKQGWNKVVLDQRNLMPER